MRPRTNSAAALIAAALLTVAPAPAFARAVHARISVPVETLDWNLSASIGDTIVIANIMEGLFGYDESRKLVPVLAESYTVSEDGRHYEFKLKPGVRWSDGRALSAQDFVDSWTRLAMPATAALYGYYFHGVANARAAGPGTLVVDLKQPCSFFLSMLTLWVSFPVRADLIAKNGFQHWTDPGKIAVLGPFIPVSIEKDKRYVLKPNPNYHGQRETIDELDIDVIGDDATAIKLFIAGKLDFVVNPISSDAPPALWSSPAHQSEPLLRTRFIAFNTKRYPLNLIKVRQAIAMAVDFRAAKEITHRDAVGVKSYVPAVIFPRGENSAFPFDEGKAKALLKETGLSPSAIPPIDIVGVGNDETALVLANVQSQLKARLGLETNALPVPIADYRARTEVGSGGMYVMSWTGDYLDPDTFFSVFVSDAKRKEVQWTSARYDEFVRRGSGVSDPEARADAYLKALAVLQRDEAVVVPLYSPNSEYLVSQKLGGARIDIFGNVRFRSVRAN